MQEKNPYFQGTIILRGWAHQEQPVWDLDDVPSVMIVGDISQAFPADQAWGSVHSKQPKDKAPDCFSFTEKGTEVQRCQVNWGKVLFLVHGRAWVKSRDR